MILMPYDDPDHTFYLQVKGGITVQIHIDPNTLAQIPPPGFKNISYAANISEQYLKFPRSSIVTDWIKLSTLITDGACEIIVSNQQRDMTDVECRQHAVLFDKPQHQFAFRYICVVSFNPVKMYIFTL